jgi:AcrR family transcriptional regulator
MLGTPTGAAAWFDRLPHGRHGLSRQEVLDSQRGRMLEAIAVSVSSKGYAATTIADVAAGAKVSRRTFYEHFEDKEHCFLAAFDTGIGFLLSEMSRAARNAGDWEDRLRAGVNAMLSVLANDPAFTRMGTVEIVAAGPAALERRAEMMRVFARQYQRLHETARKADPTIEKRDASVFAALAGGVIELVVIHVVEGRTAELPEIQPVLMQFLTAGLVGPVSRSG